MDIERAFFNTSEFYLQEEKLGEGTFGTVYVANKDDDDNLYACKIIKTNDDFNGHDQMLLMRESLILNTLKHPGIVEFKGVNFQSFDDPNKLEPSIITEYIGGGSLKSVFDKEKKSQLDSKWTPTKKYIILLGIAHAMKYLHKHGIIHRDLKPENILVDEEYRPKICDFGYSRCFKKSLRNSDKLTMTGEIGTPLYMAPELHDGEEHYSSSVDVYSFSMIAYELVTGKVPFFETIPKETPISIAVKVTKGYRPKFTEKVPKKMQVLLTKCWDKEGSKRPSFEKIFDELSKDFTFLGEMVDENEVNEYLSILKEFEMVDEKEFGEKEKDLILENVELKKELERIKKKNFDLNKSNEEFIEALFKFYGHEKERNCKEGINLLSSSSEKGNNYSSFLLGLRYETGDGVVRDFEKAKFFFEKSASQGNSSGYYAIGHYYFNKYGVKQDYSKANEYFQKASELGNSYALNNLGFAYQNGLGVKQDYSKAIEYYEKASELGNSNALNNLGFLYRNGKGVKQDYSKAIEYYEKASKLGNSNALNNLGFLYRNGKGVKQDYSKAIAYYEKASKLGNSNALNNLGNLYENGKGVKQDYSKAIAYYEKASKLGNLNASNSLGNLYENGKGVKQDYSKAIEYYEKASELGNSNSLNNLGNLYENGKGVKQDYSKAIEYYEKASELGNSNASNSLGNLQNIFNDSFIIEPNTISNEQLKKNNI